jgi:hypothetical protein
MAFAASPTGLSATSSAPFFVAVPVFLAAVLTAAPVFFAASLAASPCAAERTLVMQKSAEATEMR